MCVAFRVCMRIRSVLCLCFSETAVSPRVLRKFMAQREHSTEPPANANGRATTDPCANSASCAPEGRLLVTRHRVPSFPFLRVFLPVPLF